MKKKIRNLDITNSIISLKNSSDYLKNATSQENPYNTQTLRQKWLEKVTEKAGKIVNQAKKLRNSNEIDEVSMSNITMNPNTNKSILTPRDPTDLPKKKPLNNNKNHNNYIDENKPNALKHKPNDNTSSISLAEKLKKEILLINKRESNKKTYNLNKNEENRSFNKEGRSISVRRTMNCLLDTLSSEEDERNINNNSFYKKHCQRKSLYPGFPVEGRGNGVKTFEKKNIEKIYKEYKSRKI